jgi:hypothetical protein
MLHIPIVVELKSLLIFYMLLNKYLIRLVKELKPSLLQCIHPTLYIIITSSFGVKSAHFEEGKTLKSKDDGIDAKTDV